MGWCRNLGGGKKEHVLVGNRSLGGTPSQAPVGLAPPMLLSLPCSCPPNSHDPVPPRLLPLVSWSLPHAILLPLQGPCRDVPSPPTLTSPLRLLRLPWSLPLPGPCQAVPSCFCPLPHPRSLSLPASYPCQGPALCHTPAFSILQWDCPFPCSYPISLPRSCPPSQEIDFPGQDNDLFCPFSGRVNDISNISQTE